MSIEVNNVCKVYGKQKALDHIHFTINTGEILGFLGPNGAGKSTMMKIISGFLPATSGTVRVCGMDVDEYSLQVRRNIGYLPEHNPLYHDMYIQEYLNYVAGLYRIRKPGERIREMMGLTGLTAEKHKKIGSLSKGYRQRVGLAQALLPDPQVLILDEPTTGLDPNQIVEVRDLIRSLGKEKTILLSTHIMQEVQSICERVIILNKGVMVADGKSEILAQNTFTDEQIVLVEFDQPVEIEKLHASFDGLKIEPLSDTKFQLVSNLKGDIRPELFHFAVRNNLVLLSMTREERTLEEVFHTLTHSGS